VRGQLYLTHRSQFLSFSLISHKFMLWMHQEWLKVSLNSNHWFQRSRGWKVKQTELLNIIYPHRGCHAHDRMEIGFTTTYAISAYHHWCCEFKSRSGRSVQIYVIKFVGYLSPIYILYHLNITRIWFSNATRVISLTLNGRVI
jgi:hypothetical protein